MNSVQQDIPTRERSHFDIQKDSRKVFGSSFTSDDALCPGCGTSAIREEGGLVVAFGQSFFHVDCFRCAKCHEKVTADTNLLLLSDGSPVCANCTYCCTICQQAINDEAIMAGEDSFHAHCFKCKICKNRIDELTYARTSHGIYCMDCHNDRVARNRRHAQKKAELAASGSGGNKPRSIETRKLVQEIEQSHAVRQTRLASPRLRRPATSNSDVGSHPRGFHMDTSAKPELSPHNNGTFSHHDNNLTNDTAERGSGHQQLTTSNLSLNAVSRSISSEPGQLGPRTQPITPFAGPVRGGRRRSLDDSVRPLDVRVKRSEDKLVDVGTNDGRTSSPIDVRSVSPVPLSPAISNHTPTRKFSASNSRLHIDETYTALPKYQIDHVPNGSLGQKHQESFDGSISSPPSRHSSARQSYEMDNNPITLDPERHKKEASTSGLHPQSVAVRSSVTNGGRSPSAACWAYELHSTENELSIEIEANVDSTPQQAPPLPPKDRKAHDITNNNNESSDFEPDASTASHDSAVNEAESIPGTQVPHTAYIAPALPPIRFSMNSTDFADLLSSVSVLRSREPLIQPEYNDGGIAQAKDKSPEQTPQRITTQSYERMAGDSMADEVESKPFFERSDDVHRDSDATFQKTPITEPLIDVSANFSQPSNQQNMVYPASITNLDDAATEPVISSGDGQGVLYAGDGVENIILHLKDLLRDEDEGRILLDRKLTEAILRACKIQHDGFVELKEQHDSIKRTNKQYIEGLTIAQAEYERELKARRDAAAEITRLKVLVSAQTAKLTALSSDSRRQEQRQKSIKDAHDTLAGLENDLSRLIVQRDIILAEVQDLANTKSASPASFIRTLTQSMDNLKNQYQRDLFPLKQERQIIGRETMELKVMRDALLEETAALNARNEELAILNQEYLRRIDALHLTNAKDSAHVQKSQEKGRLQPQQTVNMTLPPINVPSYPNEEKSKGSQRADGDMATPSKKFKWPGYKGRDNTPHTHNNDSAKSKPRLEHNFTQMSILRFTRCDRCGDKMWGSQLRCTFCNMSIHVRCAVNVHVPCAQSMIAIKNDHAVPVSSMFGRDLTEQATADSTAADYFVPFIVDKCIEAVETLALDYEGIYRKNGGAGQSRLITQLFERGDYAAFDLHDSERFPDICSVTSVLKNYFRSLPVPLLTFDLYEDFISAVQISDPVSQDQTLRQLVNKLPPAHYHTLQRLMFHLHCIHEHRDRNRMNARNLGVVFGPTLMKSRNPGAEFSDMAEKARSIEWLIGNAPSIFTDSESQQ